jgi:hypothetical protein
MKDVRILALVLLVSSVIAHLIEFRTLLYFSKFVLGLNGVLHRALIGVLFS